MRLIPKPLEIKKTTRLGSGLFTLLGLIAALSGCGKTAEDEFTKDCKVAQDQAASLHAFWSTKPVPIAVEYGEFNSNEQAVIGAAIDTWNTFIQSSKGFPLFIKNGSPIQNVSGSSSQSAGNICSNSIIAGSNFSGRVMIRKRTSWNYSASTIALSSLCSSPVSGASYPVMTNAVMEVNWKDFYAAGKSQPDLQTIILHELGHIIGLDHSCGANGVASCNGAGTSYLEAVMHPNPTSSGVGGAVRRNLRTNDQERANCLY